MPYVLLCAGEDSGDVLGESFVSAVIAAGYEARGTGGARMQAAGLVPVSEYENLPVSGFGDVLPHYFRLRRAFAALRDALKAPECVGLVAIDYPGFNMKLCALAKRLGKRVLYVAPPQVWAWKSSRARKLRGIPLAVLFDFERKAFERLGCEARRLSHPFAGGAVPKSATVQATVPTSAAVQAAVPFVPSDGPRDLLLLPGSRKSQALRNLDAYMRVVGDTGLGVTVVAARKSMMPVLAHALSRYLDGKAPARVSVAVAPESAEARRKMYGGAAGALVAPGTATLELALSGCPQVVLTVPDALTYIMGSLLVKARHFAMPNILLSRGAVPEFICAPWALKGAAPKVRQALQSMQNDGAKAAAASVADELNSIVAGGKSAAELLGEFFQGNAH